MRTRKTALNLAVIALALVSLAACAPSIPQPGEILPPDPIEGNSGKYMCPYTQDGVIAMWCDKAVNASMGATAGRAAGAFIGAKALEAVPFVGGLLGDIVGGAVGRKIAIEASGGMEYIQETSDLSFNSVEEMAVWLYATKSTNEHYAAAVKATGDIYPDFQKRFHGAIQNAPRR